MNHDFMLSQLKEPSLADLEDCFPADSWHIVPAGLIAPKEFDPPLYSRPRSARLEVSPSTEWQIIPPFADPVSHLDPSPNDAAPLIILLTDDTDLSDSIEREEISRWLEGAQEKPETREEDVDSWDIVPEEPQLVTEPVPTRRELLTRRLSSIKQQLTE